MKLAVIGTGISGLVIAHRLHRNHELTVFEANDYVGGHTHTMDVELAGRAYAVDTGFIVFNDWTYPNFISLIEELGVDSQPTSMSFSVKCERTGLEYSGATLNSLFAQRSNLLRPSFHKMIRAILRFNRQSLKFLEYGDDSVTLREYLDQNHYDAAFIEHYIVPMGAAIWSTDPERMQDFPARHFIEFFNNHGLLSVSHRPQWRVIRGGSREYVRRLTGPFADRIRRETPVQWLRRLPNQVLVKTAHGVEQFDAVFIACHSDQALALLDDASRAEQEILGAIAYEANDVVLHTDESLLPQRRRAWAAWNYHIAREPDAGVAVTYNMNILQSLTAPRQLLVTLNQSDAIDPARIIRRMTYDHPYYTSTGIAAQGRISEINGANRTYFCGAYWGYGFHEDGVKSALAALESFDTGCEHAKLYLPRAG